MCGPNSQGVESVKLLNQGVILENTSVELLVTMKTPAEDVYVKLESKEESKYTSCMAVTDREFVCWTNLTPEAWFIRTVKADNESYKLDSSLFVLVWPIDFLVPEPKPEPEQHNLYLPILRKGN